MPDNQSETEAFLRALIELMEEKGLAELALEVPNFEVRLKRDPAAAVGPAPEAPEPSLRLGAPRAVADAPEGPPEIAVTAPLLGVVHFPSRDGLVKGTRVQEGQVLVIIEAMKVPHEVLAPAEGVIADIKITEGDPVEYGQLLVVLHPAVDPASAAARSE